jgi:hypothetical protein
MTPSPAFTLQAPTVRRRGHAYQLNLDALEVDGWEALVGSGFNMERYLPVSPPAGYSGAFCGLLTRGESAPTGTPAMALLIILGDERRGTLVAVPTAADLPTALKRLPLFFAALASRGPERRHTASPVYFAGRSWTVRPSDGHGAGSRLTRLDS